MVALCGPFGNGAPAYARQRTETGTALAYAQPLYPMQECTP
jgi:hypothetical protein